MTQMTNIVHMAGKNVSEMTRTVSGGPYNLNSINQLTPCMAWSCSCYQNLAAKRGFTSTLLAKFSNTKCFNTHAHPQFTTQVVTGNS